MVGSMGLIQMEDVDANELPIKPTMLWGNAPIYNVSDGLNLIDYCGANGIAVLGLEGFSILDGKRVPDMNCVIDFSELQEIAGSDFSKKTVLISKSFVEGLGRADIYFEFTLVREESDARKR